MSNWMAEHVVSIALVAMALAACGDERALGSADEAISAAVAVVGGQGRAAKRIEVDGSPAWEVDVAMSNGAELEVRLDADQGDLLEIEDKKGPFDYDLSPLSGQRSYREARDVAFTKKRGTIVAWELSRMEKNRYRYEFYVRDEAQNLWEIKLWADTGEVFATVPKDAVD